MLSTVYAVYDLNLLFLFEWRMNKYALELINYDYYITLLCISANIQC